MKSTFTLIRKHGASRWEVAIGPEAQQSEHRRFVKPFRASKKHPNIAEVQTVKALRRFKFDPVAPARAKQPEPPKPLLQKVAEALTPKRRGRKAKPQTAFAKRIAAAKEPPVAITG